MTPITESPNPRSLAVEKCAESTAPWTVPGLLRLDYKSSVDGYADWAMVLPGESPVWVVCIHGHGSSGDQLYTRADIRRKWLPAYTGRKLGILTPNLRGNAWMSPAAATDMLALLHLTRERFGAQKFIFASGSMGGTSNLIFGVLHPEMVAGIIARGAATDLSRYYHWCRQHAGDRPILRQIADAIEHSYGGPPEAQTEVYCRHSALLHADRLQMPVFLAHGAADRTIPVSQARALVELLRGNGTMQYVEIPGGGHDSPLHITPPVPPLDWILSAIGHNQ